MVKKVMICRDSAPTALFFLLRTPEHARVSHIPRSTLPRDLVKLGPKNLLGLKVTPGRPGGPTD